MGLTFKWENSGLSETDLEGYTSKLKPELEKLLAARKTGYSSDRASINLVDDRDLYGEIESLAKNYRNTDTIIVVGIGGSNLGTLAVQEALLGKLHNYISGPRVFYADSVDPQNISRIAEIVESDLRAKKKLVIIGISKSGTTTETIANFELLVEHSLKHGANLKESLVAITDKDSKLWDFAAKLGFAKLEVPKKVGGRYSVFSPVGLFPLMLLGINTKELLKGAKGALELCLQEDLLNNPAARSAAVIANSYNNGRNIHDTFLFATDLEGMGRWYRQLMGESIGKKEAVGVTPTVSVGSADLHSVAQLYLGGPNDKITTFVSVKKQSDISLPNVSDYEQLVPHIQGKKLSILIDAILAGTLIAYRKNGRNFVHIELPALNAESVGEFLQFKMIEMMYLAAILEVNAFDQPAVEHYKAETKQILAES